MRSILRKFIQSSLFGLLSLNSVMAAELTVCMIELKPWAFFSENTSASRLLGVMPDILSEFKRRSGYEIKERILPYARTELELERGSCDIAMMAWSDKRSTYAVKGTNFIPLDFGVIAKKGVNLRSYQDLKGLKISVAQGLSICPEFDADNELLKHLDKDNLTGIRKVHHQRADAVAGSILTLQYLIQQEGVHNSFGETIVLKKNDFSIAYSKQSQVVNNHKQLDAIFFAMKQDGIVGKIIKNWYGIR